MKNSLNKKAILICLGILLTINFLLLSKVLHENFSINFEMIEYPEIGIAALYFDEGNGITAGSELQSIVDGDVLSFNIPAWKHNEIVNLRFDPINYAHNVIIKRVFFCIGDNVIYSVNGTDFLDNIPAYAGISGFEFFDEKVTVFCESGDPIIFAGYGVVDAYNYYHQRFQLTIVFKVMGLVLLALLVIYLIFRYLREEVLYIGNIVNNWLYMSTNKKSYIIVSFCIYLIVRIIVMLHYRGYYFTDEFYFLAESNPAYSSSYNRAPYMAFLVKIFTKIAGSQYFAVKAVPLFCGFVSFACVMYLSFMLCKHSISILLSGLLMTFHALFIFNDFYVRMYSFQEMELLILAVILYKAMHVKERLYRGVWMVFGLILAYGIYYLTEDISGQIPLFSYLCAMIYGLAGERVVKFLKDKGLFKGILISIGIVFLLFEGLIILIKNKAIIMDTTGIKSKLIKIIYRLIAEFRIEDSVFLIKYLLIDVFFLTISFVLAGIWMFKKEKQDVFPIFLLSAIPLTGFSALLYNCRIVRTFIGYFAVMIVIVVFFWDYIMERKKCALGMVLACVITVVASPLDLSWKQFTEQLYLYHEIYFCDYGQLMQDACLYKEDGKKIIALFGGEQVLAYFRFVPDVNICVWDNNQKSDYENEELIEEIEKAEAADEEFILIMDKAGADKLHELGMYYTLLEEYEYKIYNRNVEFNSLYLITME